MLQGDTFSSVSPGAISGKGAAALVCPTLCVLPAPVSLQAAGATSGAHMFPLLRSKDKMALFLKNLQSTLDRRNAETKSSWPLHACDFSWIL